MPLANALAAFASLQQRWGLPPRQGWRMLTGQGTRPDALPEEHACRVQALLALEDMLSGIVPRGDVGAWMAEPNPGPLFAGRSPVEYLTQRGTAGYVLLLRQVRRWAEM